MTQRFLRDDGTFQPLASSGSSSAGPVTLLTKSTTADVALTTTGFFAGPAVSQGSSGTWLVIGSVSISNGTVGNCTCYGQLYDTTTTVDAGVVSMSPGFGATMTLAGILASPAGNLQIRVASNVASASIVINFNVTGFSKDSTITAFRIG